MISYTRIVKGSKAELIAHRKTRMISLILLSFAALIYGCGTSSRGSSCNPSALGIFIYFTALVPLFSCCSEVFKDMHDIPTADVQMSMPLSSSERYFSRLLTICRIWLFPFLISAAAAIGLSLIFGGTHYNYDPYYQNDYERQYHPDVLLKYDLQLMLWFLAAVLFIIAATVVCQCCIGAKAESRYLPVLMMIVLSSFSPALYYFITDNFAEVRFQGEEFVHSVWTFSALSMDLESVRDIVLLVVNCLISLAVIFGGMFICKKRDARTVGKPIVFPLFFELIMAVSLFLFFVLYHESDSFVVMFLAWLGSIILRIAVSRKNFSIGKIGIWSALFAGYYLLFLLIMYIAFLTGGFGAIGRTPADSAYDGNICRISMRIYEVNTGYYGNAERYSAERYLTDMDTVIHFSASNGNRVRVRELVDSVSSAAMKQSRIRGLFSSKMYYSRTPANIYICIADIRMTEDEATWGNIIYSADFCLNREDAQMLAHSAYELEKYGYAN